MKINSFLSIVLLIIIFTGCKDDTVIVNNNNNTNQNPNSPGLLEPANNSQVTSITPLLKWEAYQNAANYKIQVSTDANFLGTLYTDTIVSSTQLTVNNPGLITNINYYWRVIANLNGGGSSQWSAVWKFFIILPPPPAPNLILPLNNSTNQSFTPLFDWEEALTAQVYRIQISANPTFTQLLYDSSGITTSQLQCRPMILNTNTQYFWRVNASNSGGVSISEWSAVFNFTTVNGPEPNSISGRITFADANFIIYPSFYVASVYLTSAWPPQFAGPLKTDSLLIQQQGGVYFADYKIQGIPNGNYYVATSMRSHGSSNNDILGTHGCDTARIQFSNCAFTPIQVVISDNNGVTGINFLSWADSTKTIF